MEVVSHAGRPTNLPNVFSDGDDDRGSKVFEWLDSDPAVKFVPDVDQEEDPEWAGSGNGYETYYSVPVKNDGRVVGMLAVDAPSPGDLDETDRPMVVLLAQLFALALALSR